MDPSRRNTNAKPTRVHRYDGQSIWLSAPTNAVSSSPDYELGGFLGGGAAGVVYEAECARTKRSYAIKVLNPLGYKLSSTGTLHFCEVLVKGQPYTATPTAAGAERAPMTLAHTWWLMNPNTRSFISAYYDAASGQLREMTLPQCIEVWGLHSRPVSAKSGGSSSASGSSGGCSSGSSSGVQGRGRGRTGGSHKSVQKGDYKEGDWSHSGTSSSNKECKQQQQHDQVFVNGEMLTLPAVPPKFAAFVAARARIFREISSMRVLSSHPNILALKEALELVQDSKAIIFLVLELARGGELFDRIKVDCGADEVVVKGYFRQLLAGCRHCHSQGVCHRDLKPENLLLADHGEHPILKIADFGFSTLLQEMEEPTVLTSSAAVNAATHTTPTQQPAAAAAAGRGFSNARGVRRLRSVVGSPYYVAPEVLRAAELGSGSYSSATAAASGSSSGAGGYDGTKADVWSMGVILYAMLAGSLPFEKDLGSCIRFEKYSAWVQSAGRTQALRSHCTATSSSSTPATAAASQQQSLALDYPSWFFLSHLSAGAKSLLSFLLHPDPRCRPSVKQAQAHPWLQPTTAATTATASTVSNSSAAMVSSSALSASVGSLSELVEIDSDDGESLCDDVTDDVVMTLPSEASSTAAVAAGAGTGAGAVSATAAAGLTGITAAVDADVACATAVAGLIGELETAVAALTLEPWIETAVAPEPSQQPLQAQALQTQTLQQLPLPVLSATAAVPSATATPANTPLQQPRHLSSSSSSGGVTGISSAGGSAGTGSGSTHQQQRRKLNTALFSSPPLAPRGSAATRERPPSPCAFSLSIGAGTPSPSTQSSRPFGFGLDTSSTDFTDATATATSTTAADGELPPAFRDLVARSTRFCTDVPATEVLRKIAGIIDADAHPLPYPFRNITQKAVVYRQDFKLEVMRGGVLVCTVQIYLMRQAAQDRQQASDVVSGASRSFSYSSSNSSRTGLYCVEFLRGQIDIFHFKRLYDGVRRQLSALVKQDYALSLLESSSQQGTRNFPE